MSARALISGRLWREPERKVSSAGRTYATATIRVGNGDDAQWWKVLTFSEMAAEELLALHGGDAVSASGEFKVEIYDKGSGPRPGFTLFADRVLSAKRAKNEREKERRSSTRGAPVRDVSARRPVDRDLNDPLPDGWAS
jgi:hypothetical protein